MPDPTRTRGPARHEFPAIDDLAMVAARHADLALVDARERRTDRWVTFLEPLPDRLRDEDLKGLRAAAVRIRAAYGPKDSIRDALPQSLTEPLLVAVDRLLREMNREAARRS
jgi:hypothetical protein